MCRNGFLMSTLGNSGPFPNEICVLASFCYAGATPMLLLLHEYPSYVAQIPTTAQEERLSEAVFYNMMGGVVSMTRTQLMHTVQHWCVIII